MYSRKMDFIMENSEKPPVCSQKRKFKDCFWYSVIVTRFDSYRILSIPLLLTKGVWSIILNKRVKNDVEVPHVSCVVTQSNLTETVWEMESENLTLLLRLDYCVVILSSHKMWETFGPHQTEMAF